MQIPASNRSKNTKASRHGCSLGLLERLINTMMLKLDLTNSDVLKIGKIRRSEKSRSIKYKSISTLAWTLSIKRRKHN